MLDFDIPTDAGEGPADTKDARDDLRAKLLTASYDEYKELTAAWRSLDTKAQGNITVAGVFIAAAFAYLTKSAGRPGVAEQVFFVFTIVFLVVSVVLSVLVLQIRKVPPHHLGSFMRRMVGEMGGRSDEDFRVLLPLFYNLHANLWAEASEDLTRANKSKGELLWAAQVFLIMAILMAASLAVLKILS